MITSSKIEETLLSESREPDPQHDCFLKNRRGIVLRISRARYHRPLFQKCSDRVKTCETGSSHYRAMTKQGKRIALLLVVRKTPIYVDLHPQRTGRPAKMLNPSSYLRGHSQRSHSKYSAFFPPDNTSANKLY
ncbi:hypothetical protein ACFX12_031075 [Malus domestica]